MTASLPLNFDELRCAARRRLPKGVFDYIDRGTEDEVALSDNRRALDAIKFLPFALRDVSSRSLNINFFGQPQSSPFVVAPTAMAGLVWRNGEVELAKAAAAAGIPFCVATQSITPIETIAKTGARLWFQLYLWHDRTLSDQLIERAWVAGAETLLLTVDTPVSPNCEFNIRNGFGLPFKPSFRAGVDIARHPSWLFGVIFPALIENKMPTFAHYPAGGRLAISRAPTTGPHRLADSLNWSDVERLRARWKGKLILKGILRVEDALKASALGVDGIVVSNHGGRALDGAVAPARVLQAIADAVGSRICVLADSGVRRGSDAVKLLALGARAVLVGRMPLFGTAWRGTDGAAHALATLHAETERTMAMVGACNVNEIGLSLLHRDGLTVY